MSQKTIESVESETMEELYLHGVGNETKYKFEIYNIFGKHIKGGHELWSLWYAKLFEDIEDGIYNLLSIPIKTEDITFSESITCFKNNINTIINKSEQNMDNNIVTLINMRDKIENFENQNEDELTILLTNRGPNSSIEVFNTYITESDINITIESNNITSNIEEASLRKHRNEFYDQFNAYQYDKRPTKKYKRELIISLKRETDNKIQVNLNFMESRVLPLTFIEKIERIVQNIWDMK